MELVMDQRIIWDSKSLKQIDEAKKRIMAFKKQGHPIFLASGVLMEKFHPHLEEVIVKAAKVENKHTLKILNEKGDERLVWDKEKGQEAKEAKKKFLELLKKGYKAYSVDTRGQKNRKIEEFDVDAEEILMVPSTVKG